MKTTRFISTLALIIVMMFTACQHDDELAISQPVMELSTSVDSNVVVSDSTNVNGPMRASAASSLKEYEVSPVFGRPTSTNYSFKVYDLSGKLAISVKLYDKSTGDTKYYSMTRIGNYWTLSMKISSNGWYDWRYVYSVGKSNISSKAYTLCNTYNTFNSSGISSISWPFGADGSSFRNRRGWISGAEIGGCGSGHKEDGHVVQGTFADDRYAEDWNKNCGSTDDNGSEVRSPLDGVVIKVGVDKSTNHNGGYGNYIDIKQVTSDKQEYIFRIAHLKYAPPLKIGDYVRAGFTKIGNIGMSGGTSTSYHGHCVLYMDQYLRYIGIQYSFSAQ